MPKVLPNKSAILSRVTICPDTGCWLWNGKTDKQGYGVIYCQVAGRPWRSRYSAHTVAYEIWNGPVPDGLELDHLCRTRRCCRPSLAEPHFNPTPNTLLALGQHLEPVTHQENIRRSNSPPGINSRKLLCPEGHEYTERKGQDGFSWRYCATCHNDDRRQKSAAEKLASLQVS